MNPAFACKLRVILAIQKKTRQQPAAPLRGDEKQSVRQRFRWSGVRQYQAAARGIVQHGNTRRHDSVASLSITKLGIERTVRFESSDDLLKLACCICKHCAQPEYAALTDGQVPAL
ncbi:hypothetical protein D3C81_1646970 [compost metagenome]